MNVTRLAQLLAVGVLCVRQLDAHCQELPAATPPASEIEVQPAAASEAGEPAGAAETPVEAGAEVPATGSVPVADAAPAVTPGGRRILLLPVEFTVYQKSVAGVEAVPDWSHSAQESLGNAVTEMLRQDERFQVVAVPDFDSETGGLLREHVELFKIVGDTATSLLQSGGKAWADKKTNFDYTIGDGLQFLADASGADFAFLLAGAQITQTGGAAFMQLLAAAGGFVAPGGGTYIFTGIVELRSGNVKWLNSKLGQQVFGMTGSDVRKPATAAEIVTKLFEGFPSSKTVDFPPF